MSNEDDFHELRRYGSGGMLAPVHDDQSGEHRFDVGHHGRDVAGWYPDPVGDHDLRYHNGVRWTGDVSTDGQRFVAPLVPPTDPTPRRTGTLALVAGIIAVAIAWIPFVCAVGIVFAVVAIVSGLRCRRDRAAHGAAIAGIVTGLAALLLAAVGTWLSFAIVREVIAFEDPGRHAIALDECVRVDDVTRASGTIENLEDDERSYVVTIDFEPGESGQVEVDDVGPGEVREFAIEEALRFPELNCTIVEVTGPFPFGIDIDE
jgi:Protein of unknown function (DUF2510)